MRITARGALLTFLAILLVLWVCYCVVWEKKTEANQPKRLSPSAVHDLPASHEDDHNVITQVKTDLKPSNVGQSRIHVNNSPPVHGEFLGKSVG